MVMKSLKTLFHIILWILCNPILILSDWIARDGYTRSITWKEFRDALTRQIWKG